MLFDLLGDLQLVVEDRPTRLQVRHRQKGEVAKAALLRRLNCRKYPRLLQHAISDYSDGDKFSKQNLLLAENTQLSAGNFNPEDGLIEESLIHMSNDTNLEFYPKKLMPERILYLDYLRAIACLLVVLGHVYFMGFNEHKSITPYVPSVTENIFGTDSEQRNLFTVPALFMATKFGINVGRLGVSIFFLISGFVILKSLEQESAALFLVRRIFRIYPVSIGSALVVAAATSLYCKFTDTISPHTWQSIMSAGLVATSFLHHFHSLPVIWSLEVELFFYAFMAILASIGCLGYKSLLALGLLNLGFTLGANSQLASNFLSPSALSIFVHISFNTLQITFLIVGSMIYLLSKSRLSITGLASLACSIVLFVVTRYGYLLYYGADSGGVDLANGAWALAIFYAALLSGMRWKWIIPLRWLADISYPLYLIHIPIAWIILAWLGSIGWGMLEAGAATGLILVVIAWTIHLAIENPGRRLGGCVAGIASRKSGQFAPKR